MKESNFQSNLKKELERIFPGCIVTKLDPSYIQGIPDLLVLYNNRWATLECKRSENAEIGALQPYYVDKMNKMSFSRFIYPSNKNDVINDLIKYFE